MECPCPCEICGTIFDLEDGYPSERLKNSFGNIVICEECGEKEKAEIELNDELDEIKESIEDAEWTVKDAKERWKKLTGKDYPTK